MTNTPDKSEMKACPPSVYSQERFADLSEYARAASCALMKLSGGGSEMFTRIGEEYYAVPRFCVERANHRAETIRKLSSRPPADEVPDMVERVARAICAAEGRDPDRVSPFIKTPVGEAPDLRHDRLWKNYETAATAAIAALQAVPAASTPVPDMVELLKPWADYHGDLPDYDHPLRPVFESGIQYAVELLAKVLRVEDWELCDGTEEFDGDLGGTLLNIVIKTWPEDEHGDWLDLRDPKVRAALQTVPAASGEVGMREALTRCRDKFAEYVELHRAKLHSETGKLEADSINAKVARNQEMVDLCDTALKASGEE